MRYLMVPMKKSLAEQRPGKGRKRHGMPTAVEPKPWLEGRLIELDLEIGC